jgi:hypothetical protein
MAKIGRYVERALDRLTVTTMLLCSDSVLGFLEGRPASAGLSFALWGWFLGWVSWVIFLELFSLGWFLGWVLWLVLGLGFLGRFLEFVFSSCF